MKDMGMDNVAIATALFAALAADDAATVRRLCAADFTLVQNGGAPMGLEQLLRFNAAVHRVVPGFGYSEAYCSPTTSGFVEEHVAGGTMADGTVLRLTLCVVADVTGGRVSHVREYFDSAAAARLVTALSKG
jgi:ketosteroid isomerase-like protein